MNTRPVSTMRRLGAIVLSTSAVCGYASAQTTTQGGTPSVTRAGLLKELQDLKSVGFDINDNNYPDSLQESLRKLEAKHQAEAGAVAPGLQPARPTQPTR